MAKFIPWNSQHLDEWASKYAPGKFINLEGHSTHYIEKGEGDPIILLHGFGGDSNSWDGNIDALAEHFKVYALDLWGCGYSTRELLDFGYPLYSDQLLNFIDTVGIERAHLIGQSMGGGTIIYFAARHRERVKSIVLVCSGGMPNPPIPAHRIIATPLLGEIVLSLPTDFIRKLVMKRVYLYRKPITKEYFDKITWSQKIKGSNETFLKILRLKFFDTLQDEIHRLGEMDVPILIVWGRHDKGIPLKRGQQMQQILKGSQLVVFEQSAHEPHDEQPEEFNRIAISFLTSESGT